MELTFEQMKAAVRGAVCTEERDGLLFFHRFTPAQEAVILARNSDSIPRRTLSPAGVRLVFRTDSRTLGLAAESFPPEVSRRFYSVDVFSDGTYLGGADNFSGCEIGPRYGMELRPRITSARADFDLGEGEKTVALHLPWSVPTALRPLILDDGAGFVPVPPPEKALLFYGDSITQGYDALRPHRAYSARLADALGLEERNKAIAADTAFAALAALPDEIDPAAVVIAYGTNDWSKSSPEVFQREYRGMLAALTGRLDGVPIFAMIPLTRADREDYRPFGPFSGVADVVRRTAADYPGVTVIDCSGFFPDPIDLTLYSDGYLHPSQAGFDLYFEKLLPLIRAGLGG